MQLSAHHTEADGQRYQARASTSQELTFGCGAKPPVAVREAGCTPFCKAHLHLADARKVSESRFKREFGTKLVLLLEHVCVPGQRSGLQAEEGHPHRAAQCRARDALNLVAGP